MGRSLFHAGMAEALGTFFLTFVGGSAMCMDQFMGLPGMAPQVGIVGIGLLGVALAHGLALMVAVYMTANKSGAHINPAVSFGLWAIGKIKATQMLVYAVMQLAGAVVGGFAVWALFYKQVSTLANLHFETESSYALSPVKAMGIEALLTFLLMTVVLNTAVDAGRAARQMFGLCIGMTVTFGILIGGPFTGAAMNPARYFGTAVASGHLEQLWVYFVGPILGAVLAAFFYKLFMETPAENAAAAEPVG